MEPTANSTKIFRNYPVIERIEHAMKKFQIKEVTEEDKTAIGKKCSEVYFSNPQNLFIRKETILEKNGPVDVWVYPSRFVPVMDKIIVDHFKLTK